MCNCQPMVRRTVTIEPRKSDTDVRTVVLTLCNCDRRKCPVNGCDGYVDLNADRCPNGHKS